MLKAPAKRSCRFATRCVEARGEDIEAMTATGREIAYRTFIRYLAPREPESLCRRLGYKAPGTTGFGIHLKDDRCVRYYRGEFKGQPCVWVDWSRIEHVFTQRR